MPPKLNLGPKGVVAVDDNWLVAWQYHGILTAVTSSAWLFLGLTLASRFGFIACLLRNLVTESHGQDPVTMLSSIPSPMHVGGGKVLHPTMARPVQPYLEFGRPLQCMQHRTGQNIGTASSRMKGKSRVANSLSLSHHRRVDGVLASLPCICRWRPGVAFCWVARSPRHTPCEAYQWAGEEMLWRILYFIPPWRGTGSQLLRSAFVIAPNQTRKFLFHAFMRVKPTLLQAMSRAGQAPINLRATNIGRSLTGVSARELGCR
jgi:hypothetical protein